MLIVSKVGVVSTLDHMQPFIIQFLPGNEHYWDIPLKTMLCIYTSRISTHELWGICIIIIRGWIMIGLILGSKINKSCTLSTLIPLALPLPSYLMHVKKLAGKNLETRLMLLHVTLPLGLRLTISHLICCLICLILILYKKGVIYPICTKPGSLLCHHHWMW